MYTYTCEHKHTHIRRTYFCCPGTSLQSKLAASSNICSNASALKAGSSAPRAAAASSLAVAAGGSVEAPLEELQIAAPEDRVPCASNLPSSPIPSLTRSCLRNQARLAAQLRLSAPGGVTPRGHTERIVSQHRCPPDGVERGGPSLPGIHHHHHRPSHRSPPGTSGQRRVLWREHYDRAAVERAPQPFQCPSTTVEHPMTSSIQARP